MFAGVGAAIAGIPVLGITPLTGASIGLSLGGYFFAGSLMPRQVVGRMSDLKVQGATQGTSIPLCFGKVRVPCNLIYTSGLKERKSSSGGGKRPRVTNYSYSATFAALICQGPIVKVLRILADSTPIYDDTGASLVLHKSLNPDDVRIYLGSESQTQDPALVDILGVDNTPAYLGRAYVVFEDLPLRPFGDHHPNLNVELDAGHANLKAICEKCAELSGLKADQYDFDDLEDIEVEGYVVDGRTQLKNILEELSQVFMVDFPEIDGKIVGVVRGGTSAGSISWDDMGAGIDRALTPRCETKRQQEVDLPFEVTIAYGSPANSYQMMTQAAKRLTRRSQLQTAIQTQVVMSDDFARQCAEKNLYMAWAGRVGHQTSLSSRHLAIAPSDIRTLAFPGANGNRRVRVVDLVLEGISVIQIGTVEDEAAVYTQGVLGGAPYSGAGTVAAGGDPLWEVFDVNPYKERDEVFVTAAAASDETSWSGGSFLNADNSNGYPSHVCDIFWVASTMGAALTDIGTGTPWITNDQYVDIEMKSGELASITADELLHGFNLALLGKELIQFQTAALIATNQYRLSGIVRGLRGSEWAIPYHDIGESFVLLIDESGNETNFQTERYLSSFAVAQLSLPYRFMEADRDYSSGLPAPKNVTLAANSRRPWAPVHLAAERDGGLNVTLTWVRRARIDNDLSDLADVPLDEPSELYDLEIYDPTGATLLRTVEGLTDPEYVYTASEQTQDLEAPGPFKFKVFQVTTYRGLGRGFGSELKSVL